MTIKTMLIDPSEIEGTAIPDLFEFINGVVRFDKGVWIAGGFARKVGHHFLINPVSNDDWVKYFHNQAEASYRMGDIDIFMPAHLTVCDVYITRDLSPPSTFPTTNAVLPVDCKPSFANFAAETNRTVKRKSQLNGMSDEFDGVFPQVKFQFVNHPDLRYETIEACLDNFDLTNCRYALSQDWKGQWILHYDEDAVFYDKFQQVKIRKSDCPFIASRLLKYVKRRGLINGISPDSVQMLSDWCVRVACDTWPEHFAHLKLTSIQKYLEELAQDSILEPANLTLFLGKWTVQVPSGNIETGYGEYRTVDWAKKTIDELPDAEVIV